jgi:hypothetical protein
MSADDQVPDDGAGGDGEETITLTRSELNQRMARARLAGKGSKPVAAAAAERGSSPAPSEQRFTLSEIATLRELFAPPMSEHDKIKNRAPARLPSVAPGSSPGGPRMSAMDEFMSLSEDDAAGMSDRELREKYDRAFKKSTANPFQRRNKK